VYKAKARIIGRHTSKLSTKQHTKRGVQCQRPEGFCLLSLKEPTFGGPPAKSKSHESAAMRNAFELDFDLEFDLEFEPKKVKRHSLRNVSFSDF
jgi:hypothetical protein